MPAKQRLHILCLLPLLFCLLILGGGSATANSYYADADGSYLLSAAGLHPGRQYLLLVTKQAAPTLAQAIYLDQQAADSDGNLCFASFRLGEEEAKMVCWAYLCGETSGPILLGQLRPAGEKQDISAAIRFAESFHRTYDGNVQALTEAELATIEGLDATTGDWTYTWLGEGDTRYGPITTPPVHSGVYRLTAAFDSATASGSRSAAFVIEPRLITITATDHSARYGCGLPALDQKQGWRLTSGELVNGDTLTVTLHYADTLSVQPQVGIYPNVILPRAVHADYHIICQPGTLYILPQNTMPDLPSAPPAQQPASQTATSGEISLITPPASDEIIYWDVQPGSWYQPYLAALTKTGLIEGYPDGSFRPQTAASYGETLKLLLLAAGCPVKPDATQAHWASAYLGYARENGLLDHAVELDAAPSRGEIAEFIAALLQLPDTTITPFQDEAPAAAASLYAAGIITGNPTADGRLVFCAEQTLTRAEISAIAWRVNIYCRSRQKLAETADLPPAV